MTKAPSKTAKSPATPAAPSPAPSPGKSSARSAASKRSEAEAEAKASAVTAPKKAAPKKAAAEPTAEKPAVPRAKKVAPPKPGAKQNALQQPKQISAELATIVGAGPMPRGEVVSKMWKYINEHKLKSPEDGRVILADETLAKVLGKPSFTMFEMNKLLSQHLS